MKKIMLCTSAMLLGSLALENINVEGMEPLKPLNLTGGNGSTLSATSLASVSVPSNISAVAAAGQENANGIEQTAPATQEMAATKEVSPPDSPMFFISKYFNGINDYINIEKCCKEYNGLIEQFKYNPIPFQNAKERELFKNIETYHFYGKNDKKNWIAEDTRIKQCIHWEEVSYSYLKENKNEKNVYKNVEFNKNDMIKYLLDHEEGDVQKILKEENVVLEEGITSIRNSCFWGCRNLSTINIPTSVSSIGEWCFYECYNLSTITIPTSVSSIGKYFFYGCRNLSSITIPTSVSYIGKRCFDSCSNLSTINIPTSVSYIGEKCFVACPNLSAITIPTSVSYIGEKCFVACPNF